MLKQCLSETLHIALSNRKSNTNSLETVFATTTMTAAKEAGHGRQGAEVHKRNSRLRQARYSRQQAHRIKSGSSRRPHFAKSSDCVSQKTPVMGHMRWNRCRVEPNCRMYATH